MKYATLQGRICICSGHQWFINALSSKISVNHGQSIHCYALHLYICYSYLFHMLKRHKPLNLKKKKITGNLFQEHTLVSMRKYGLVDV